MTYRTKRTGLVALALATTACVAAVAYATYRPGESAARTATTAATTTAVVEVQPSRSAVAPAVLPEPPDPPADPRTEPPHEPIERQFAEQATDPAWSATTEHTLRTAIESLAIDGLRVDDVVCRATACRIDLGHDSEDARNALVDAAVEHRAFAGHTRWQPDPQTPDARTTAWLARPGTRLDD